MAFGGQDFRAVGAGNKAGQDQRSVLGHVGQGRDRRSARTVKDLQQGPLGGYPVQGREVVEGRQKGQGPIIAGATRNADGTLTDGGQHLVGLHDRGQGVRQAEAAQSGDGQ